LLALWFSWDLGAAGLRQQGGDQDREERWDDKSPEGTAYCG
jgi:hypothetical protein